jgi:DNA-binding LytR/AlgR family response regulator
MMNCLIIENSTKVIEKIKSFKDKFKDMSFTCVSENHKIALNLILKSNFDLIFYNIDSTEIKISDFLFEIQGSYASKLKFIALSSSKENAYEAYTYNFCDFLLKPLSELSIRKSLLKFQKQKPVEILKTICLKSNKDYRYLCVNDILFLKADNNTTDFYMSDGTIIGAYKTLKTFENSLPNNFLRIHKSYIINSNCISRIHYGKSICTLNNSVYKLPFTKTFLNNVNFINDLYYKNVVALN